MFKLLLLSAMVMSASAMPGAPADHVREQRSPGRHNRGGLGIGGSLAIAHGFGGYGGGHLGGYGGYPGGYGGYPGGYGGYGAYPGIYGGYPGGYGSYDDYPSFGGGYSEASASAGSFNLGFGRRR